jgi:signal transduction histidine kinase
VTDHDSGVVDARPLRPFSVLLNVAGVAVVGFFLVRQGLLADAPWVIAVSAVALLAWLVRSVTFSTRRGWDLAVVIAAIGVIAGSLVALPTDVLGYLPALVCLAAATASPFRPIWLGLGLAVLSLLIVAISALVNEPVSAGELLGAGAALLVAVLVAISRRQFRAAAVRERELLEERLRLSDEREHAAALTERSRIARDIHDVLAHSLGGLVLQLDAVDALFESGKTAEAHSRVVAARSLAASGLDEARRAVDALRDPDDAADVAAALAELVATHRSLGADATLTVAGTPGDLTADAAGALRRAAQEELSNARRHAPGQPTSLTLAWSTDAATLTASTPLAPGSAAPSPGGGRGLSGLRERVEVLGGRADWAVRDGVFVVSAEVPR